MAYSLARGIEGSKPDTDDERASSNAGSPRGILIGGSVNSSTAALMPATPDQIRSAVLDPNPEVQRVAIDYWTHAELHDPAVMPLVIRAIERQRDEDYRVFSLLRSAEHLVQTPDTLAWLAGELQSPVAPDDIALENHHYAAALAILWADTELLAQQHREIRELPGWPEPLNRLLDLRLCAHGWDWPRCRRALFVLGEHMLARDEVQRQDQHDERALIAAATRHGEIAASDVYGLLKRGDSEDPDLADWLQPVWVELAGRMGIERAIPLLIECIDSGDEWTEDEIGPALGRIGTRKALLAVAHAWWDTGNPSSRIGLTEPLERIKSDLALERSLAFLEREEDLDVAVSLAGAALSHFDERAIEPCRRLVLGDEDELDPEELGVRDELVAAATVMGETFPEYDAWCEASREREGRRPMMDDFRLAEAYTEADPSREL